jgi:hypothetical protein
VSNIAGNELTAFNHQFFSLLVLGSGYSHSVILTIPTLGPWTSDRTTERICRVEGDLGVDGILTLLFQKNADVYLL